MTTFLLIRHAEYAGIGTALIGRTPGIRLDERGQAQAQALAERLSGLPIRAIYTSPLERARETALPLGEHLGLQVRVCWELNEINFGEWQGRTFAELGDQPRWQQWNAFRSGGAPPGGETMLAAQARMVQAIAACREHHPHAAVALVSHSDMIKAALTYFLGMPLDLLGRLEIAPASVSALQIDDYGARLLLLNHCGEVAV
jgi:probable phosphomutase (TIGR03848 family)